MFVDPQKARREEQERQLKIRAEQERQKKLRLEEEKRKAKIREEEKRKAKLRADAKAKESEPSETEPKSKQPQTQIHHQFEANVAARAQGLLKANKDRLNAEQTQYLQDNNPKSDRWSRLWQVAAQRREFQAQHANLLQQLEFTTAEIHNLSDIPDGMGLMATPQERQNSFKNKRLLALSEQKKRLGERIAVAKQMQVSLEYLYPALSAVKNEMGANPEDIKRVQRRLPEEFDGIRGNINKLSAEVTKDPSTALLFDSVVTSELLKEGHNQAQRKDLTSWLEDERGNKERLSQLGQAVGGGLFLASFIPQLRGGAALLRMVGAGTMSATFAYDVPDLMLLNAAAQSGRGGAGQLTSQSLEQARFNLVMGYANVALAGLDVGAEVGVIRGLERLVGQGSVQGAQVLRQTWVQVMSLARQGDAGLERARELLMKAKGVPQSMVDEVMEVLRPSQEIVGVGKLSRSEMRGQTAQMTTEEALKTAKAKKHVLGDYANAGSVKSFIGTKVDPNNLPEGYLYGKIPLKDGTFREVVYMSGSDKTMVPLKVDSKGKIQMGAKGEYRIVDDGAYPKNVETIPGEPGKILGKGSQVHHLYADNMLRSTPFGQRALRLGAVNPDDAMNLIELANSLDSLKAARQAHRNVQFSDFVHNTQHKKFDALMQTVVDDEITAIREAKGISGKNEKFIPQMTKEEIKAVWDESLTRMRDGLMNEDKALYKDLKKITRPTGSLAQGENSDNSEVA